MRKSKIFGRLEIIGEKRVARGVIVIGWDNKIGAILEAKHPPQLEIDSSKVTAVYSIHTMSCSCLLLYVSVVCMHVGGVSAELPL